MATLKATHEHMNNFHNFQVDEDVLTVLRGTGFENMLCLASNKKLNSCLGLVEYAARAYDVESNCFKLRDGVNFYLGLEDVFEIWGLPIVGLPIVEKEYKCEETVELVFPKEVYYTPVIGKCRKDKAMPPILMSRDKCIIPNKGFNSKYLANIAMTRENDLETRVRATVLYLIGTFAANSSSCTPGYYGILVVDIDRIKKFAWGELMMVSIHEGLHKYKRSATSSTISGSVFTIMIFMILHVKPLQAMFGIGDDFAINNWPVIKDVATVIHKVIANSFEIPTYNKIQEIMDACTVDDITWRPYPSLDLPPCYETQRQMFLAITPVFMFNMFIFHTPHCAPRQFGISNNQMHVMANFIRGMTPRYIHKDEGYIFRVKGMQGTGHKDYFAIWKEKLKMSVSDFRKKVFSQIWLTLSKDLRDQDKTNHVQGRKKKEPYLVYRRKRRLETVPEEVEQPNKMCKRVRLEQKRKLLVLDVNGLLAHVIHVPYVDHVLAINDENGACKPRVLYDHGLAICDENGACKLVFKRPGSDDFLKLCFEKFDVGVWTSRQQRNLDQMVDFIFGDFTQHLKFSWAQECCTELTYGSDEYKNKKPIFLKELQYIWSCKKEYDKSNTLLLDDSPEKSLLNPLYKYNAVFPHSYCFLNHAKDNFLKPGGNIYVYLQKLADAENVPNYVEQNFFGQKPITEENKLWDSYQKLVHRLRPFCSNALHFYLDKLPVLTAPGAS